MRKQAEAELGQAQAKLKSGKAQAAGRAKLNGTR